MGFVAGCGPVVLGCWAAGSGRRGRGLRLLCFDLSCVGFTCRYQRIGGKGEPDKFSQVVVIVFTTDTFPVFIDLFYYQLDIQQAGEGYFFAHFQIGVHRQDV